MHWILLGSLVFISLTGVGQTPCENGFADIYPCNQVDLLAHLSPSDLEATVHGGYYLNDLWGWTDSTTQKEYALVGLVNGVVFIDVSDPVAPIVLGKLPEPSTAKARVSHEEKSKWRDIKTYGNYAFIVSDINLAHGMQVFDLTKLRGLTASVNRTFEQDAYYDLFGSAHNIAINEQTGYAYATGISIGTEKCAGGLHVIDINAPLSPAFAGCFSEDGYTHDTQVVIYKGPDSVYEGKEIAFNSNEDALTIVDVSDKSSMKAISINNYENHRYSHQGWLSEDHRFFFMNDELDEKAFGHTPKTLIWNVQDLDAPVLVGSYLNNAVAIDHNLYVHGDLLYESNYFSGLRIMDIKRAEHASLREVAYFDTYPQADAIAFGGTWSNYPYFQSGTILVSDMNNGLFLLKLALQDEPITFQPSTGTTCDFDTISITESSSSGSLTIEWQHSNGNNWSNVDMTEAEQDSGRYRLKVINQNKDIFYSYPLALGKNPKLIQVDFDYTLTGSSLDFRNLSSDANYQWNFGDGQTSMEANPTYTYPNQEDYMVTLYATGKCGTISLSMPVDFVPLSLPSTQDPIQVYPNPVKGNEIHISSDKRQVFHLVDQSGKIIFSNFLLKGTNTIPLPELPCGTYLIKTNQGHILKILKR